MLNSRSQQARSFLPHICGNIIYFTNIKVLLYDHRLFIPELETSNLLVTTANHDVLVFEVYHTWHMSLRIRRSCQFLTSCMVKITVCFECFTIQSINIILNLHCLKASKIQELFLQVTRSFSFPIKLVNYALHLLSFIKV